MPKIELLNEDCMEFMKSLPDKAFDLAIVDPPYGIGANAMTLGNGKNKIFRGKENWDIAPPKNIYFEQLDRVSVNQIIWGANHFANRLVNASSPAWIFWDKGTGSNDFADGELAYTSFGCCVRKYFQSWVGANAKERKELARIHPTQKPVKLYEWLLTNYAKKGDKILDTHGGSGSSAIACHNLGFDMTWMELDKDYYDSAVKRFNAHTAQARMFGDVYDEVNKSTFEQADLL